VIAAGATHRTRDDGIRRSRQQLWTHFDGYQLSRDLHLRALVGGDAHYGGPEDLCSVARDYETEHLMARFAAVDRQRLMGPRTAA
jgi:hypothetical protein